MRKHRFAVLVLGGLLVATGALAQQPAESDQEEQRLARELLEVSGAGQMGAQMMEQMVGALRSVNDQLPDEFWTEFLAGVDVGEMTELVIPIYVKHLTAEEMSAAVEFYRTPEGAAIIRKLPLIMQESMAVGQEWGMEIARSAAERVEAWQKNESEDG